MQAAQLGFGTELVSCKHFSFLFFYFIFSRSLLDCFHLALSKRFIVCIFWESWPHSYFHKHSVESIHGTCSEFCHVFLEENQQIKWLTEIEFSIFKKKFWMKQMSYEFPKPSAVEVWFLNSELLKALCMS